ncbi:putative ribonuclease H-like domain-containing protein [Tanacetum coccineum]
MPRVVNTARPYRAPVNTVRAIGLNDVNPSACWVWKPTRANGASLGNPQMDDKGFVNSGCSGHMTGNIAYLSDFKEFNGGYVTFGGRAYGGRISGKGTLKIDTLDFKDFPDESHILLRIPREDNMYSFDMKNIIPKESLTCLVAKATSDESILMHKKYCLVVTDDFSKFTWVLFLATKDETSKILNNFIKEMENLVDKKVKIIRCDNGTKFKNKVMDDFCKEKDIRMEFNVARNPQQNRVAERRNKTLIEAARTMLADSKLPTTFWAKAISTACYVQNRVLIVKPHNKTPYELFRGFKPAISFMKPFGCHVTILNTLDNLGKFNGKSDEGFFIRYSLSSKAFRVYNTRTRKVEENLHIGFLENKPMIEWNGPKWLFDIDSLNQSMNYIPVTTGTSTNESIGTKGDLDAVGNDDPKSPVDDKKRNENGFYDENDYQEKSKDDSSTKQDNTADQSVNTASPGLNTGDHPMQNVIGDMQSSVQTRRMSKSNSKHGFLSAVYKGKTYKDLYTCLFACFLSHDEPKRIFKALSDPAWVEAMQKELLNKKDERGIVIRNKARLVTQRHTQEEGIDYDEVFAHVAKIKAIRLFLAYASFMGFMVYQMDVKSDFLHGQIEEEVYVCQPLGFEDPDYPEKVYKQRKDGIFISQDKYVDEILRKFNYTYVKSASTLVDLEKPLVKDGDAIDDDEHLYRSMIESLMYLTASRLDIMFADSPFKLVAYTDSGYVGATQDRKPTTRGCQFLGNRLISWQCKKQTMVATSTTEAEYVAAASCYGQVLWIQNQILDYGYNFMKFVIHIDNNSTICIIENPVQHSKTKHIKIRHHFIRDCNAKKLIQMVKIDTEHNVDDLLAKGFDIGRFQYLVSSIRMLNP